MIDTPPGKGSRALGLWSATALVVGHTIGVGIFLTPAELIGALASPALTFGLWLLCGALVLAGALTFGELASRFPQAGGLYVYLREAWGERVAFVYGWQCLLVMDPGVTAALAAGTGAVRRRCCFPASPAFERWIAAGIIRLLALLAMAGLRLSSRVLGFLTAAQAPRARGCGPARASRSAMGAGRIFPTPAARPSGAPPLPGGARPRSRGRVLLVRRILGGREGYRRSARSGPHSPAGPRPGRGHRDRRLRRHDGCLPLSRARRRRLRRGGLRAQCRGSAARPPGARRLLRRGRGLGRREHAGPAHHGAPSLRRHGGSIAPFLPRLPGIHPRTGSPVRATAILAALATLLVLAGLVSAQIVAFFLCTTLLLVALAAGGPLRRAAQERPRAGLPDAGLSRRRPPSSSFCWSRSSGLVGLPSPDPRVGRSCGRAARRPRVQPIGPASRRARVG